MTEMDKFKDWLTKEEHGEYHHIELWLDRENNTLLVSCIIDLGWGERKTCTQDVLEVD